jgi:hypothetical protein
MKARTLSGNNEATTAVGRKIFICHACGKTNISASKFCGGCGKPVNTVPLQALPQNILPFPAIKNSDSPPPPSTSNDQQIIPANSNPAAAFSSKVLKLLKKLPAKKRKVLAGFLALLLGVLLIVMFNGNSAITDTAATVHWHEFRTFLVRTLDLPSPELDRLFAQVAPQHPSDNSIISLQQAKRLETILRKVSQNPNISIFPNPFYAFTHADKNSKGFVTTEKYIDVPVSHRYILR